MKRLHELESIAGRHEGVDKVYAMHAGREIRVIVEPGQIDDDAAALLSHQIARDVEKELEYPGQIKVTVIRESRTTDYARWSRSRRPSRRWSARPGLPAGRVRGRVREPATGSRPRGVQLGVDPRPYRLSYELDTVAGFVTARLAVNAQGDGWSRRLDLRRAPDGSWTLETAAEGAGGPWGARGDPEALEGATDCDLGFSPLTNTMPILRDGAARPTTSWPGSRCRISASTGSTNATSRSTTAVSAIPTRTSCVISPWARTAS